MPLSSPKKDESQKDFIKSCMGDKEANKTFPDQKQRAAVCYGIWKKSKSKKKVKASEDGIGGIDEIDIIVVD